jgi:hypothetical protein
MQFPSALLKQNVCKKRVFGRPVFFRHGVANEVAHPTEIVPKQIGTKARPDYSGMGTMRRAIPVRRHSAAAVGSHSLRDFR